MGFNRKIDVKEWHKIGDKLTSYFKICSCQRKLKTIIDNLVMIKDKCKRQEYNFTGAEWLLISMMDRDSNAIHHGINCEYPMINDEDPFWMWIEEIKDNPNLEDN